jgi:hypothetical protein
MGKVILVGIAAIIMLVGTYMGLFGESAAFMILHHIFD